MNKKKNIQAKNHQNPQNKDQGLLNNQAKNKDLTNIQQQNSKPLFQQQGQKSSQYLEKDMATRGQQQIQNQFSDNQGDRPRKQTCIQKNQEISKEKNQVENEIEVKLEQQEIDGQINQFNIYQKQYQTNHQIQEETKQIPRVCLIEDHYQRQIECICTYSECPLSRFLCNKCLRVGNHKHQQSNQDHILDNKELYEMLIEKIQKMQSDKGVNFNQLDKLPTYPIKQIMYEILNRINGIVNMLEQMEQEMRLCYNDQQLDELLRRLKNNEFDQFDEKQLNILINIDKKEDIIFTQLLEESNNLHQNVIKIQDQINRELYLKKIKNSTSSMTTYELLTGDSNISASAVSNDFKYVVTGGTDKKIKIWNYNDNKLIKTIQLNDWILSIKFTDDSKMLYVGKNQHLIKFDADNNFIETYNQYIHLLMITNIDCITNTIILTSSSYDQTIIKTDINKLKSQLLLIKAHDYIHGFDYNRNLQIVASASRKSIKLWNENNGQLILEKGFTKEESIWISQILFIMNNQLISLSYQNIIIWRINYEKKQMELLRQFKDSNCIYNISLILEQQFISLVCDEYVKIYSINGDYIRQYNHYVKKLKLFNLIQSPSLKALIIQGEQMLQICKVNLD